MRSLKLMALARLCFFLLILFSFKIGYSQINSPYSRYGLGDLYNSRNVHSKAMGSLTSPIYDAQSVNFLNPASYSHLQTVTFDVGAEFESRKLRNPDGTSSYRSNNLAFNYLALGIPLMKGKDGINYWGMALGLRPITRMNYNVAEASRINGIDSINTVYKGNGGMSKAYIGTGIRIKGFAIGANIGFLFGQHTISTQRILVNDTVPYFSTNHQTNYAYSRLNLDAGAQWDIKLNKKTAFRLAATAFFGNDIPFKADRLRETIYYSSATAFDSLDVVERNADVRGSFTMPSGYSAGFAIENTGVYTIGAEYEKVNWNDYRFDGKTDLVGSSGVFRMGGQWVPSANTKKYLNRISYRLGFYTGKDFVKVDNKQLPVFAATFGFGFPIRRWNVYTNQFTVINTSFEIGKRANKDFPVTENFFRMNLGLSLSDLWFNKRKYD